MCGITGYYSSANFFLETDLRAMTNALEHRGPDASGFFLENNVALGHRRLKIIDLSDIANQPMVSHNGRFIMVYNGEVYNYLEIKKQLEDSKQVKFKTSSDSEVILEAFSHYGHSFVNHLNGMFAIAIYDKEKKDLFIFRDRSGIKPLFYYWDNKNLAFASELKALTKVKSIPQVLNKKAINYFLHLGYIPTPHSIYHSIFKLEAGHYIHLREKKISIHKYWSAFEQIGTTSLNNEEIATKRLNHLLDDSVSKQLNCDVPYGVFLSGGIDSSLIAAKASTLSTTQINTFSIGFKEQKYNESMYAKTVAEHLKTNHHEFIVSYTDAINLMDTFFECYDEPYADSSAFPTLLVSKLAKQYVTVCLSGDGGDELFLGYGAHLWAKRLNSPLIKTLRKPISLGLKNSGKQYTRHASYFNYPNELLKYSHIFSQEQNLFSLSELNGLLTSEFIQDTPDELFYNELKYFDNNINNVPRVLNPMEKQAIFDMNFYLQEDLLTKVDRASMHYSLETRVPYLDHTIIEFALNLSPDLKYKSGNAKYLLKKVLYQHVPKKLFDRPKQGFSIPLESWLKTELRFLIEENLCKGVIEQFGIVDYTAVQSLLKDFESGKTYLYNRIWLLIVLHRWFRKKHHSF